MGLAVLSVFQRIGTGTGTGQPSTRYPCTHIWMGTRMGMGICGLGWDGMEGLKEEGPEKATGKGAYARCVTCVLFCGWWCVAWWVPLFVVVFFLVFRLFVLFVFVFVLVLVLVLVRVLLCRC